VTGPPGIGKTTAVGLIVRGCGYELVEFNASDERSASAVRKYFDEAKRSGCCGKRRVIVMDEVDGMSTGDRGGIGELARVIASCVFPIICIANERGTPRLRPLASCCLDIRFQRPTKTVIAKALYERVVKAENLGYTVGQLEELCERNGNDIRSVINALQFSATSLSGGAKDELQRVDAFSATGRLIGGGDSRAVKEELVFLDYGMIPLMVAEGYVAAVGKPRGVRPDDTILMGRCATAGSYLGDYDILDRRIRGSQTWSLMPYAVSAVVSTAVATEGIAPFQIFPSWLGKQSKRLKHRRWLRDMRGRGVLGGSGEGMLDTLDCLRSMLFVKGKTAGEIVERLVDIGATRDDMLETITDMTYKEDAGRVALDTKTKGGITREWKKIEAKMIVVRGSAPDTVEDIDDSDSDAELDMM
jgi:replication factor C subunit 1